MLFACLRHIYVRFAKIVILHVSRIGLYSRDCCAVERAGQTDVSATRVPSAVDTAKLQSDSTKNYNDRRYAISTV